MTFLHGGLALAGLLAVSIPILIHLLLRQRRRPIVWAAMRFLMEAYKKQQRKLRLQQLLLLLVRCLIIALLGLALARPLLEGAGIVGGGGGRVVYVLIDNGLASSARGADGETALDRHRASAMELLDDLGPGDQAGLIALAGPAESLVTPASSDIGAVRQLIESLSPAASATDLAGGLRRLSEAIEGDEDASDARVVAAVLSDFYRGSADLSRPLPADLGALADVRFIVSEPRSQSPGNVQVVGVAPLRSVVLTGSGGSASGENVRVTLRRTGPAVAEAQTSKVALRLSNLDGEPVSRDRTETVRWRPGQSDASVWVTLDTETSDASGQIIVAEIDRDAAPADNAFRRLISVREALRVGVIDQRRFGGGPGVTRKSPADWIRLALQPSDRAPVDIDEIDPAAVDVASLASLDAVFVTSPHLLPADAWSRLADFADGGGMVVVTPSSEVSVHLWTDAMERAFELGWRVAREPVEETITLDESAFGDLLTLIEAELPALARPVSVMRMLPVEETGPGARVQLRTRDGRPWLVAAEPGGARASDESVDRVARDRGLVVYLASAPDLTWTSLPAMPLMVPLLQEIVRQGVGQASGAWSAVAGQSLPTPDRTVRLASVDRADAVIDVTREGSRPVVRQAGLWNALDEAGRRRGVIAVNADPAGGLLDVQSEDAVREWLAAASAADPDDEDAAIAFIAPDGSGDALNADDGRSPVSFPLLLTVLGLAVAETGMARWFSHARRDGTASEGGGA